MFGVANPSGPNKSIKGNPIGNALYIFSIIPFPKSSFSINPFPLYIVIPYPSASKECIEFSKDCSQAVSSNWVPSPVAFNG